MWRSVLLVLHALACAAGVAYFVLAVTVGSTPDANIGAGLALLWLAALGSPWSWPLFLGEVVGTPFAVLVFAGAGLNLLLLLLWWRAGRRSTESAPVS